MPDEVAASPLFCMFTRDERVAIVQPLHLRSFEPGEIAIQRGGARTANPGQGDGDSLLCLAPRSPRNLLHLARRQLARGPSRMGSLAADAGPTGPPR